MPRNLRLPAVPRPHPAPNTHTHTRTHAHTRTDCLYEVDIPPDVAYTHVQLVAKELPPLEFVREVGAVCNAFWAAHPQEYIAVHCAYGACVRACVRAWW
jgi:hypothetical protein